MPRKRNYGTIVQVLAAAWQLFGQKGYNETSYADLARVSGVNRATVQHYFPKKEMLASLSLHLLRSSCAELASERWAEVEDPIARHFIVGQIYVSALLSSDNTLRFARDVLESRTFTEETIATDLEWSMDQVYGQRGASINPELRQDVIAAMSGLYGLMFHMTSTGEPFDLGKRLRPGLKSLGALSGRSAEDCDAVFDRYVLGKDELDELAATALDRARLLMNAQYIEESELA